MKIAFILFFGMLFSPHIQAGLSKQYFQVADKDVERLKRIPGKQEIAKWEEKIVSLTNSVRIRSSLPKLSMKQEICNIAKKHSENMASGKAAFGHEGFEKRAQDIFKKGNHNAFGENVAYTYLVEDPLATSLKGWMESPSHRDNILGDFNETGVGIAFSTQGHCYITQLFAKTLKGP